MSNQIFTLDDITLISSNTMSNFGVIFDEDMSFSVNIEQMYRIAV